MLNVIGFAMLIATAALLIWSSNRACGKKGFTKWGGAGLAAPLAAAVSLLSVLAAAGLFKLHARRAPVPDLAVAANREWQCR